MRAEAHSVEESAHLIIFDRWVMLAGQCAYFIVIALLYFFYLPVVPERPMTIWLILASSVLIYIILFDVTLFARNPSQDELLRFWRVFDTKHTILFDLIAVGIVALMLPYGTEAHRLVTVSFCVGYVPLQMISDPQNVFGNRFSIISVLGAFVGYLLMQGEVYAYVLACFMVIYGATLFFSSGVFRDVVIDAVRNRRAAELASERLERAVREVSAERDAKTRFIAAVSHDLGQPLQAARLFSEQLSGGAVAVRDRALSGLNRSIGMAQDMLRQMLYHMQLEADAVRPHQQSAEVKAIAQGIAERYVALAQAAGMTVRVVGRPATMMTDGVLLERALGNLVQNSINHSGGSKILIGCRSVGDDWQIWVLDNGVGIAAGEDEAVFEDYEQGSNSRSLTRGGFGLGLASVRRLARVLGGDVHLDRRWTNGAAFCLTFPSTRSSDQ
jgi:signal transduction histidine kinase